jgi:hypothetical protein
MGKVLAVLLLWLCASFFSYSLMYATIIEVHLTHLTGSHEDIPTPL